MSMLPAEIGRTVDETDVRLSVRRYRFVSEDTGRTAAASGERESGWHHDQGSETGQFHTKGSYRKSVAGEHGRQYNARNVPCVSER